MKNYVLQKNKKYYFAKKCVDGPDLDEKLDFNARKKEKKSL